MQMHTFDANYNYNHNYNNKNNYKNNINNRINRHGVLSRFYPLIFPQFYHIFNNSVEILWRCVEKSAI